MSLNEINNLLAKISMESWVAAKGSTEGWIEWWANRNSLNLNSTRTAEFVIKTTDPMEAKRLAKSNDMASFIWELVHNGWIEFKETDIDYIPIWSKIDQLLADRNIIIDDLYN
jgi:hypothetical protein